MARSRHIDLAFMAVRVFAGLAATGSFALAQEFDPANPESVKTYRAGFRNGAYERCMADVELRLEGEGKTFGQREQEVSGKFCGCSVDGIIALIADDQIAALKTVMTDPALRPQRQKIVADCARAADQNAN